MPKTKAPADHGEADRGMRADQFTGMRLDQRDRDDRNRGDGDELSDEPRRFAPQDQRPPRPGKAEAQALQHDPEAEADREQKAVARAGKGRDERSPRRCRRARERCARRGRRAGRRFSLVVVAARLVIGSEPALHGHPEMLEAARDIVHRQTGLRPGDDGFRIELHVLDAAEFAQSEPVRRGPMAGIGRRRPAPRRYRGPFSATSRRTVSCSITAGPEPNQFACVNRRACGSVPGRAAAPCAVSPL